jgi:hypothetical protein
MGFSEFDIVLQILFDGSGAGDESPLPGLGLRWRDDSVAALSDRIGPGDRDSGTEPEAAKTRSTCGDRTYVRDEHRRYSLAETAGLLR